MPTYEYRCKDCGEELEVVQSFTDDALTECPNCGGTLRKVFGNIGVTFKGSGFYRNDHGSTSKPAAKKESESSTTSDSTSSSGDGSTKSDSSTSTSESSSSKSDSSKSRSDAKAKTA